MSSTSICLFFFGFFLFFLVLFDRTAVTGHSGPNPHTGKNPFLKREPPGHDKKKDEQVHRSLL